MEKTARLGLERVTRPRLYEQLVEQILAYIESAQLGPGDLLPAERDLAERLGSPGQRWPRRWWHLRCWV